MTMIHEVIRQAQQERADSTFKPVSDMNHDWRQHFSVNAGDILQVQRVFAGEEVFKALLIACLKRGRNSQKINERTVCAVLSEMK